MHQRKAEMDRHSDAFIALPDWYKHSLLVQFSLFYTQIPKQNTNRKRTSGRPMLRYEESFIEQDLKPSDAASGPISPMDTKRSRDDNDPNDIL
ncbi:uncharacterized protein LOC124889507 isoform X1 [Capsicum annuum]|uniref:uncharacterized protein LOC124889507 isoform X1 n=1 Tax=Capsicum annuum TaxID=4072 RepID=UPI001FB0D757|nr:uncharacterized protein LOC124889507 isoform X1 [Capsicum annuum]